MTGEGLRIGYLIQDFPPEVGAGPARVLEFSRRWVESGAEVTVVTGMPHRRLPGRADGEIHPDYRGRLFMEEETEGVRVLRSWLFASPNRGFLSTVVNNASFMATGALHALRRLGKVDVLIASSPPFFAHPAGDLLRIVRRLPVVMEVRDLWPDYLVEMGTLRPGRLPARALLSAERRMLRKAAGVTAVTESFRRRIIEKGVPEERTGVFPNGTDTGFYRPLEAEPPVEALRRRGDELIVGYLGNFGAGQELRTVVDAAARLAGDGASVRFVLAGDGKERARVEAHLAERAPGNVELHAPIPKESTPAFYNACDLCLVPLAPLEVFNETVPSKLFEILACGTPVLASVDGEARAIVEESGGGMVRPPGDDAAMADAIRVFAGVDAGERAAMGRRGRRYIREHYERGRIADRYLEFLERFAAPARVAGVAGAI